MEQEKFNHMREEFHANPELSGQEAGTSARIIRYLEDFSPAAIHKGIGGHGVIAEYVFPGEGATLLFRADMDAVAVAEDLPFSYTSRNAGVSHKCGHDGHTTILLALAELFHRSPLPGGRVLLLFQPAEENGQGARAVLDDPFFRQQKIDAAFALHNLPGYPASSVVCRAGSFTCSVVSCAIRMTGKTAHAAEPEKSISPTPALLEILHTADSWNDNRPASADYFRSTLIELHIGSEAYGVAAGEGLIRLTLRAAREIKLQERVRELESLVRELTQSTQGLQAAVEWIEPFAANENEAEAVEVIREAAQLNHLEYLEVDRPFAWGEDFGLFTQHFPGAIFGLGAGTNTPPLHTPGYDFPNRIITDGARMFYEIAREGWSTLNKNQYFTYFHGFHRFDF